MKRLQVGLFGAGLLCLATLVWCQEDSKDMAKYAVPHRSRILPKGSTFEGSAGEILTEIEAILEVQPGVHAVFGREANRDSILLLESSSGRPPAVLATFPTGDESLEISAMTRSPVRLMSLVIDNRDNELPRLDCVLLEYEVKPWMAEVTLSKKYLRLFLVRDGALVWSGPSFQIAEDGYYLEKSERTGLRWAYVGTEQLFSLSRESHPRSVSSGVRGESVVLTSDTDDDGFQDIVVWRRSFVTKPIDEQVASASGGVPSFEGAWIQVPDELWVAHYDAEHGVFEEFSVASDLPRPPEMLWDQKVQVEAPEME